MSVEGLSSEQAVFLAVLADKSGRTNEMKEAVKFLACQSRDLSDDERSIFTIGYRKIISAKRQAWRNLIASGPTFTADRVIHFRNKIESEINTLCSECISVINKFILPRLNSAEGKVYF